MVEVQEQQELRDVLQGAQTALEEGRPQEAITACQHVLHHYPDAITALRLLGEACLEAGRSDDAARAFDKALSIDPHNVLARVGLGVIAEDRGEDERAIAQFRLAWEVEPTLPQLRGELVRLYRKRYGAGGRLRLTRVALANLHRRNDELIRAIGQLRQIHGEDPNRPEVTLALAEALWRHDEDEEAAFLCQSLLAERPRTARALLMLASIQGDNGAGVEQGVDQLLAAARGYDPDLTLTGELIGLRPSETLLAFAGDVPTVPAFDPAAAPLVGTDELLSQGVSGQAMPMTRWEDIASGLASETSSIRSATSMGVVNGVPTAAPATDEVDELFAAIDRELAIANEHGTGTLPEVLPFDLPDAEAAGSGPADEWAEPAEDAMMPAPDEPSAVERLTANWDNIDNELAAARPNDDVPVGMTGMLSALGDLEADLLPFDVDKASQEEEETISFDPSKFSLPPLDDEDDDDLALEVGSEEDGVIAPFSLEAAGVRPKTSGLTFADLVQKEGALLPSASGEHDHAPDAEPAAVTAAASIFATRELSSLPEDELLGLQAVMPDTNTLGVLPGNTPDTSPIAGATPPGPGEGEVLAPAGGEGSPLPAEAEDVLVASEQPAAVAEAGAEETAAGPSSRAGSSTADLDKLLSTGAPRMVAPPPTENYPVDATRPLLADEAFLLGVGPAADDEDHLVSKLPTAPAEDEEPGMDKLFNRLRHRKQERIQTGELLVNRRLQSANTPGVDTGEIAGPLAAPKRQRERRLLAGEPTARAGADLEDAPAESGQEAADGAAGDTADFLAALSGEGAAGAEATATTTPAESVAAGPVDDSWLTALVDDTAAAADTDWVAAEVETASAPVSRRDDLEPMAAEGTFAALLAHDTLLSEAPAAQAAAPQPGGTTAVSAEMPEHPEPPAALWPTPASAEAMPHWGDEAFDEPVATVAAPANGRHAAASRPLQESVVMRVRTPAAVATPPGSRPLAAAGHKAGRPTPRQTEQLALLSSMVEADPENHFARLTLAVAYVSSRQPELALNEYRRLIKDADDLVPEVIERLKEMIADGDVPARTHRVLGDAYMKLGQFDLAMAEFQRALSSRPRVAK